MTMDISRYHSVSPILVRLLPVIAGLALIIAASHSSRAADKVSLKIATIAPAGSTLSILRETSFAPGRRIGISKHISEADAEGAWLATEGV